MVRVWVLREINSCLCSKTQGQKFLLVSGRHVGAHLGGHQHGVSIQISINLGESVSPHIFHKKNCCHLNLGEGLSISTFFLFPDSGLNLSNGFDFLFWSILNGVTLKTSNRVSETSPLKKIGLVYLVREMSEGNVYILVKKNIMRVRGSCLAISFEIDRFVIYFYFFIVPNNVFINLFFSKGIAKFWPMDRVI